MASTQRTPRARGTRDPEQRGSEIADLVSEKVAETVNRKVSQQVDKVAEKIARKRASHPHLPQHVDALERLATHLEALEVWTRSGGPGRRPRFTREEIAAAAVHLADTEGFEALSMRRLAAELGAGTMTLYHYVRTKDELMTLVNDAVMGEVVLPADETLPDDWRAAITVIAQRTRQSLERHPWMFDIVDDPPIGPNALRHFDQTMQAVASLGVPLWDRLDIVTAVDEYVFGYCIHARNHLDAEHGGKGVYSEGLVDYIEGLLATGDYPYLEEVRREQTVAEVTDLADRHSRDPDRFIRNLDRLLDGIEADLARRGTA